MNQITSIITNKGILPLVLILALCSAFTPSTLLPWEKLGMRIVDYGLDRDEIPVTLAEGTFSAVKLIVNRSPINMNRFVIPPNRSVFDGMEDKLPPRPPVYAPDFSRGSEQRSDK